MKLTEIRIIQNSLRVKRFFEKIGLSPVYLVIPTALLVFAAFLEGISLALLIPTIKGIMEMNFAFLREAPFFGVIIEKLPFSLSDRNSTVFTLLAVLIFGSAILKNVFRYVSTIGISKQVQRFEHGMRSMIFARYLRFGKLFFDQHNIGQLQQTLLRYPSEIAQQLNCMHDTLYWTITLFIYLGIMFFISWQMTLLILAVIPVYHYMFRPLIQMIKDSSVSQTESIHQLGNRAAGCLTCMPLIKAYSNEDAEQKLFDQVSRSVSTIQINMEKKSRLIMPTQEIVMLLISLVLVSSVAFLFIRKNTGELSGYLVMFLLIRRSASGFGTFSTLQASLAAVRGRIVEMLKIFNDRDKHFVPNGNQEFDGLKSHIEIRELNFSYRTNVSALHNCSFVIEMMKKTAIVGKSGSGKSTLVSLIMRFYDCPTGSILVNGSDIRDFTLKSLRRKMALVSQDTLLFNTSLEENLCYGLDRKVTKRAIDGAIRRARLETLVKNLPMGFKTEVGERGVQLSGGERQRVSIARAILKGAEILLLDEATSSLDTETEQLIQRALDDLTFGKTTIIIAHRLSTIKNADKICIMENGRIIEEGTLSQLLEKRGRFSVLWNEQKFI
jgi:ATP-binding cassette, subfamily B, bacterial MsbA